MLRPGVTVGALLSSLPPQNKNSAAVAYFMSRQPLGPTWWPDHKMNICHQVIVEHHCISTNRGNMLIYRTQFCIYAKQRNQISEHLKVTH